MSDHVPLPPVPVTYYPRPYFPPPQRRPHTALGDPLLDRLAPPPARPRLRRRSPAGVRRRARPLGAATRVWNDVLGVWAHCTGDCRTRGRCCGDPLGCLPRYLPLLPAPARLWFAAIGLALERGMNFTDALAAAEREGAEAVCERWQTAVARALTAVAGR